MSGLNNHPLIFVSLLIFLSVNLTVGEIKDKGWWTHTVFYQIYPRSFKDSTKDGIGDLQGIIQKLDHFVDAGVGGIWLSPINRSPMVDFGYDISDFTDIDSIFGNLNDFEQLVKHAKERGLKVILDLVPNHTSDEHYWFQESIKNKSKYRDYYIWKEAQKDGKPPNNWISVFDGSAWTCFSKANAPTGSNEFDPNIVNDNWCYFHQFHMRQPDLNYTNPLVQEEMESIIRFWLKRGVDGFRIDAVPHLFESPAFENENPLTSNASLVERYSNYEHIHTKDLEDTYKLVQKWRNILDDYADRNNETEKIMMTEAYTSLDDTVKYYNYGSHIPFNFNFIVGISKTPSPKDFQDIIVDWMKRVPSGGVANWVMGNHDRSRTASRFPGRGDQMIMLEMILPGVAVTYYGEEIGMEDNMAITFEQTIDPQGCNAGEERYKERSRDPVRTPFQWSIDTNAGFSDAESSSMWLPVHSNYKTVNLAAQKAATQSYYKIYQSLIKLRNSSEPLQRGDIDVSVFNDNKVLAVRRKGSEKSVTFLMNFDKDQNVVVDLSNYLQAKPDVLLTSLNVAPSMTVKELKQVEIPKQGAIILESTNGASSIFNISLVTLFLSILIASNKL